MPSRSWQFRIFGVDLEIIWKTVKEDLPYLKNQLLK